MLPSGLNWKPTEVAQSRKVVPGASKYSPNNWFRLLAVSCVFPPWVTIFLPSWVAASILLAGSVIWARSLTGTTFPAAR